MSMRSRSVVLGACVGLVLGCPGQEPIVDDSESSGSTSTSDGVTTSTTTPTTGPVTTGDTGETGTPAEGLVVTVTPESPRSGASAQLTATFDGQPAEVVWELVGGPGAPELSQDGVFAVPMTAGKWTVRATLKSDPNVTDDAKIVADFRGGQMVTEWGGGDGRWAYNATGDDDWAADLVADADSIYAAIDHGSPTKAILGGLVEATGLVKPGFGTNGIHEFVAPGNIKVSLGHLALGGDRLYVAGKAADYAVLAAASPVSGAAVAGFGAHSLAAPLGIPFVDPGDGAILVGTDDYGGTVGARRVLAGGAIDMSWGLAGKLAVTVPPAAMGDWEPNQEKLRLSDLAVDDAGRLYLLLVSYEGDSFKKAGVLMRYDAGGEPDAGFGIEGAVVWGVDGKFGTAPRRMRIDEDGSIVVVGDNVGQWFARCYTADGALDDGWGFDGDVTHEYQRGISMPAQTGGVDLAILPGGYIVFLVNIDPGRTGLVRYTPAGQLDANFGDPEADGDGWSRLDAEPRRLAGGSDGRVFVLGQTAEITGQFVARDVWVTAVHSY